MGRRGASRVLATVLTSLAFAPSALASPWHLGAEVTTDVPAAISGRVSFEMPLRLRLSTSVGVLPEPYVALINEVVVAAGGYDESTAAVVESALASSLVWRSQVGWRPLADWGLYFDAGYSLATLGAGSMARSFWRSPPELRCPKATRPIVPSRLPRRCTCS